MEYKLSKRASTLTPSLTLAITAKAKELRAAGEEGVRDARLAAAAGAADAVDVVLDGQREGVVDDHLDVGDVDLGPEAAQPLVGVAIETGRQLRLVQGVLVACGMGVGKHQKKLLKIIIQKTRKWLIENNAINYSVK